ncbi:MAG: hypothetical protein ABEJ31_14495 [Haloarculaceae archaeon]
MDRDVKLNELDGLLDELTYPSDRVTAAEACSDVTLLLADGTENLGQVIAESDADGFDSADELRSEIMALLPRNAVGEPYQSEGEG